MRISTSQIYDLGTATLQQGQQNMVKLQQQLASNMRVVTPSDDPIAAASVLGIKQSQAVNDQYKVNADGAKAALGSEETALTDLTNLLQDVKTLAINAGNATLNNADRLSIATDLQGRYQELMGIANRDDGNGQYLFSGFQVGTRPFAEASPGSVTYSGDAGQRHQSEHPGAARYESDPVRLWRVFLDRRRAGQRRQFHADGERQPGYFCDTERPHQHAAQRHRPDARVGRGLPEFAQQRALRSRQLA